MGENNQARVLFYYLNSNLQNCKSPKRCLERVCEDKRVKITRSKFSKMLYSNKFIIFEVSRIDHLLIVNRIFLSALFF